MTDHQMTDKELRKLSRAELLEMLVEQSKQVEFLQQELKEARAQLQDRRITLDKAGSIAEASLRLNRVFEAADAAAKQYLENLQALYVREAAACKRLEERERAMQNAYRGEELLKKYIEMEVSRRAAAERAGKGKHAAGT